jgi:hypothetical protein
MANLERKAKTYERLERGMTGGLTEEQIAALPLDASGDLPVWPIANRPSGRLKGGREI